MKNKASCPKCSFEFPIEAALADSVRKDVSLEFDRERLAMEQKQKQREQEFAKSLELAKRESRLEFEKQRTELLEQAKRQAALDQSMVMRDQSAELELMKNHLANYAERESAFLKERNELEFKRKSIDLEIARGLDNKAQELIKETEARLASSFEIKLKERELQIEQLMGKVKEMSRTAGLGSQQLQGESLEVILVEEMQTAFPDDLIRDVKKGARGGDYCHIVRTRSSAEAGSLHIEAKNTKDWGGDTWIAKAKEDARQHGADVAVIVSVALPKEMIGFGMIDGVVVCSPAYAKQIVSVLRISVLQLHRQKWVQEGMKDAKHAVYEYFSGKEFRQRFERLVEVQSEMRDGLEREKRLAMKSFAQREKLVDSVMDNLVGVFGDLQGLIGEKNLPDIPLLAIPMESEEEEEEVTG